MPSYLNDLNLKIKAATLRDKEITERVQKAFQNLKDIVKADDSAASDIFKANLKILVDLKIERQALTLDLIYLHKLSAAVEKPERAAQSQNLVDELQSVFEEQEQEIIKMVKDYLL